MTPLSPLMRTSYLEAPQSECSSRTFEMAKISGSAIAGKSQDLAYYHVAVLEKGSGLSVYAQCVTFSPKDPVPTGSAYNVGSFTLSFIHKCI